jgi:uncharacterized protein YbjQ (UPF0145 family)
MDPQDNPPTVPPTSSQPQYSQPGPQYQPAPHSQQRGGQQRAGMPPFDHTLVTSAFELPGYTIVRNFGLVRGIIVRSRSIFGSIGAGFQQLAGGNISLYTELCERTRTDAYEIMIRHAAQVGANALIGVRYDATEISPGVTEVLCYGTAVTAVPSGQ